MTTKLLLGPGPSNAHPRVLQALGRPLLGHLDPEFLEILDEAQGHLADLFNVSSGLTVPISATGSAGMEACFVNMVQPGDRVIAGVNGVFGGRMAEVARRAGAEVTTVEAEWGQIIDPDQMVATIEQVRPSVVGLVHAETSTGVQQPVAEIAAATRAVGGVVILDCVTSLGGVAVELDKWGVDVAYSGSQKCLSVPPGMSPVHFSDEALVRLSRRERRVQSWYLDINLLAAYYLSGGDGQRVYHHTAPISMVFALAEGLRVVAEEGMEAREARHREAAAALITGLSEIGMEPLVEEQYRLPQLTSVRLPDELLDTESAVRSRLLTAHNIEVGAGLGTLAGKIWRIGLMGENARLSSVDRLLSALQVELPSS